MGSKFRLNDEVIGRIAQLVQLAILTGIDIVDYLRQLQVEPSPDTPGQLQPTVEYDALFAKTVEQLQQDLAKRMAEDKFAQELLAYQPDCQSDGTN